MNKHMKVLCVVAPLVVLAAPAPAILIANGGFETGDFTSYTVYGNGETGVLGSIGSITPSEGSYMGLLSTGPFVGDGVPPDHSELITDPFVVDPTASLLTFQFNMVTAEDTGDDAYSFFDWFEANLLTNTGTVPIEYLDVSYTGFSVIPGGDVTSPGGSEFWYTTGWLQSSFDISPYAGETVELEFFVADHTDAGVDTGVLLDNIGWAPVPEPTTLLMMLGGLGAAVVAARKVKRRK